MFYRLWHAIMMPVPYHYMKGWCMQSMLDRLRPSFSLLARHSFGPLLLSSLLACALLAMRVRLSGAPVFVFLVWNLFLAWLPYGWSVVASRLAQRRPAAWWWLLIPGGLWLLFFPNALYLVTDFIHLRPRVSIPLWYDIGMLAAFAWSGCFLAVASLRTMQSLVVSYLGGLASWLFVFGVIGLNGLGVYLGRFLRWNSWDLFLDPRGVLADTLQIVANPLANRQATGAIGLFSALLLVCYVMFWGMSQRTSS
jgi:uncharacterized membrane protein